MLYDLGNQGLGCTFVCVPVVTPNHFRRNLSMTTKTSVNCFHRKERWPSIQPSVLVRLFNIHKRMSNFMSVWLTAGPYISAQTLGIEQHTAYLSGNTAVSSLPLGTYQKFK